MKAKPAVRAAAAALAACSVLACAGAAQAAVPRTTAHHTVTRGITKLFGCLGARKIKPGGITLACADGNDYLSGLRWSYWGHGQASAAGTRSVNTCVPYCAAGHFVTDKVVVLAWRAEPIPHQAGQWYFTRITVAYSGKRPAHVPAAYTQTLPGPRHPVQPAVAHAPTEAH